MDGQEAGDLGSQNPQASLWHLSEAPVNFPDESGIVHHVVPAKPNKQAIT